MKLEDIGFYTLSDERAKNASESSPLHRCEILITDKCNFKCPYCRGMREDLRGTMSCVLEVLGELIYDGLRNVRFSGGEPTIHPGILMFGKTCKDNGVERIAVSTNGSAGMRLYEDMVKFGFNDFSVSLDSCCASEGDKMAGNIAGSWNKVVETIKFLAQQAKVYTTVGMVFTDDNWHRAAESVMFADSLGVSDIRVVPSAQFNKALVQLRELPASILDKYPILRYRINNVRAGRNVREMCESDCGKCRLALDDMAVAGGKHFPCIIYLREGGNPIGNVGPNMRRERAEWVANHDSRKDPICKKMCLDVCIDYNNRADELRKECEKEKGMQLGAIRAS
jgi:molybdenum cofactor biosynthesis enzyme MoaA